jgi:hypothetical protein
VFKALEALLRKAETVSHTLESASFLTSVEGLLNSMIRPDGKAVRDRGDKNGTANPTGKGKRHQKSDKEQSGETFPRSRAQSLRLSFVEWDNDKIGAFAPPNTVQLNLNHAGIGHLRKTQNRDAVAWSALSILVAAETLSDGKQTVIGVTRDDVSDPAERFNKMFGELTRKPLVLDGRELTPTLPRATAVGGDA